MTLLRRTSPGPGRVPPGYAIHLPCGRASSIPVPAPKWPVIAVSTALLRRISPASYRVPSGFSELPPRHDIPVPVPAPEWLALVASTVLLGHTKPGHLSINPP